MKTFNQFIIEARTAESDRAFYNRIYRQAKAAGDRFPGLTAAQAGLESGFGTALSGENNPFGQKASANQKGTVKATQEVGAGGRYNTSARFQDFDSEEEATRNRVNRWSYKYGDAKDLETAARNLQLPTGAKIPGSDRVSHGVYATDPTYASRISQIARDYGDPDEDSDSKSSDSKPIATPKPDVPKKVIQDKGGKGGTVSVDTAYKTKLGGVKATSTRGETGTQIIRANLGAVKTPVKDQKVAGTLGGQKGTIEIKGGQKTFTATKPTTPPKSVEPAPKPVALAPKPVAPAPKPAAVKPAPKPK